MARASRHRSHMRYVPGRDSEAVGRRQPAQGSAGAPCRAIIRRHGRRALRAGAPYARRHYHQHVEAQARSAYYPICSRIAAVRAGARSRPHRRSRGAVDRADIIPDSDRTIARVRIRHHTERYGYSNECVATCRTQKSLFRIVDTQMSTLVVRAQRDDVRLSSLMPWSIR